MKNETTQWLAHATENLASATLLLKHKLFNSCLQNVQQCIEKSLKAAMIEHSLKLLKTHSIAELKQLLANKQIVTTLSDDECDFIDSIYLPSRYPLGNVLPHFVPDEEICINALSLAERTINEIKSQL
ncbi:MAG: hypothetical protein A2219_03745 [Elusimicrobia bacterium RIFOXYA2_FULL_50_26]|nr:MAG: hypothetical protein A2219_03745 [Elusimicrobia bacterium RIFOXYA2_FULL_50_26]OGS24104.1 MAG: hypothetical protein A2314_02990 [Elusimicrobia bacterium RIFOXYB2_FULL_50_12]